jgi:hypothetical protein
MNPHEYGPEYDPAIAAAFAVEQEHELENQRRAGILQMVADQAVPTYDQLVAAQEWATEVRANALYDEDGNLMQEGGLTPIDEATLSTIEDYFDEGNWTLSVRDLALCREVTDNNTPNSIEKVKVLAKSAPDLRTILSANLPESTEGKLEVADRMTEDIYALVKLDKSIKAAREPKTEVKDPLVESGLMGINIDKAMIAMEKAIANGVSSYEETESGLTLPQKNALLEVFGYKKAEPKFAEDPRAIGDPTFLQLRRRIGLNNLVRPDLSAKENVRRFLHGSETKPAVAKRMQLETDIAVAQRRLDVDAGLPEGDHRKLSWMQRKELRARVEDTERKIQKGSFINPDKYGTGASRAGAAERDAVYNPAVFLHALERLKARRDSVAEGTLGKKIHAALTRGEAAVNPNTDQLADFDIELDNEKFFAVADAIIQKRDSILAEKAAAMPLGGQFTDYDIDMASAEAQLVVAQDIADDYFATDRLGRYNPHYSTYVRQLIQALHAYDPEATSA